MINSIYELIRFSGQEKKGLYWGIFYQLLYSLFEALPIMGILLSLQLMLGTSSDHKGLAIKIILILLFSFLGRLLTHYLGNRVSSLASFKSCARQRLTLGQRLKKIPMGYFNAHHLGQITSVITRNLDEIQALSTPLITQIMVGLIHALVITLFLLSLHWSLGLVALIAILLGLLVNHMIERKMQSISQQKNKVSNQLSDAVLEFVKGIGVVKSYGLSHQSFDRVESAILDSARENLKFEKRYTLLSSLYRLVFKLASTGLILTSATLYLKDVLTLENAIMANIIAFVAFSFIEEIGASTALLETLKDHLDKVNQLKDVELMDWQGGDQVITNESIRFEEVAFSYGQTPLLNHISFEIKEGSKTAIVGPSGGGKSTVCKLMARFWDVDKGQVLLGGVNVKQFSSEALMAHFSMVFQNVYLFRGTLEDNIRLGKPHASREEIIAVSKKAGCHGFISQLEKGYDTIVEEGGNSLSGGEKQRISIARAMLKAAPIIILDEATASVDPENEWLIQKAINHLTQGKTVITIAHRLSTIKDADQILVIDKGQVVERGRHEDLMKNHNKYYDFVKIRERAENWKI